MHPVTFWLQFCVLVRNFQCQIHVLCDKLSNHAHKFSRSRCFRSVVTLGLAFKVILIAFSLLVNDNKSYI